MRAGLIATYLISASIAALAATDRAPVVSVERVVTSGGSGSFASRTMRRITGAEESPLFVRPYGVAWDGDALVVTDPGANRVVRIERGGRTVSSNSIDGAEPIGVAVCTGRIFVTDSRRGVVDELSRSMKSVGNFADGLTRPTGIACSTNGLLIAETGSHRLVQIGFDGTRREIGHRGSEPGEFNFPTSLATAGSLVLVGDAMNFRVQGLRLDNGTVSSAFGQLGDAKGNMPRVKGVAVDPSGVVWVADGYLDEISAYGLDGRYLGGFGGTGDTPGRFAFPAGMAFSTTGRLAIVDSLNKRVQVFKFETSEQKP